MAGIVVVSHSSKIAEGVVELVEQMTQGRIRLKAAGGTEDNRIGTDAMKIQKAILEVDDGTQVLIFMDLGSAIMSAEMALDFLEEDLKKRVTLVDAPLVEGVLAGSIQATITEDIEEIIKVAKGSKNLIKIH